MSLIFSYREDLELLSTFSVAEFDRIIRGASSRSPWPGGQNYLDFQSALNNDITLANYLLSIIDSVCQAQEPTPEPRPGKTKII